MIKIKYNLLGFTEKEVFYYNLKSNDYRNYISTAERDKLEYINDRFADILGEKVMLERIWGRHIHVPKTYVFVKNGFFADLDDEVCEIDVAALLERKGRLLAKPTRSTGGGHGVCALSFCKGKYYIGKQEYGKADFIEELRNYNEYLISEWIYPHEYAKKVFPDTTNTMRIVTYRNHLTNKAEIMLAVQRFGTKRSIPVDNGCSGGVYAFLDIETGILEEAHEMIDIFRRHEVHPDTGEKIRGIVVPKWSDIRAELIHVHNCFPYFEFLAWDVVLADDGNLYVIEINRGMDLHWLQVIRPLRNEHIGKFMREKGYLRKW